MAQEEAEKDAQIAELSDTVKFLQSQITDWATEQAEMNGKLERVKGLVQDLEQTPYHCCPEDCSCDRETAGLIVAALEEKR